MMDPGDTDSEQTAKRELAEETGYSSPDWTLISSLYPNPATHTNRIHIYLALDATREQAQRLDPGEEDVEVVIAPIGDVLRGLREGSLVQAMQVSAVLMGLAVAGRLKVGETGFEQRTAQT